MMSHKAEENKYERPQAYANSGLESLAAEASRRAESMDADLDARGNNNDNTEDEPKSPTRSSGPRGKVQLGDTLCRYLSTPSMDVRMIIKLFCGAVYLF